MSTKKKSRKERTYKNKTLYIRAKHDDKNNYTKISNTLIKDGRLSFTEIGMMVWLLSNKDTYIFNSDYTQEFISGLGQDVYDKAKKHLQKLGYLRQERGFGFWYYVINENPECPLNGTKMEKTSCLNNKCGKTQMLESTDVKTDLLISTNPTLSEPLKEIPTEKNKKDEIINNEKPNLDESFSSEISIKNNTSDSNENDLVFDENNINQTPNCVKNDLQFILENNSHFKYLLNSGTGWNNYVNDISKLPNSTIAFTVVQYLQEKKNLKDHQKQSFARIPENKKLYFLQNLIKYSKELNSDIWKCFEFEVSQTYDNSLLEEVMKS